MAENPATPKVSIRNDGRIVVQNQVAAFLPSAASIAMVELTDQGQWKEVRDGK
jgi:hypothetical protein